MIKKFIYTLLVFILILTSLTLAACHDDENAEWENISYKLGYSKNETDGIFLRNVKSISKIVDSKDDLIELCEDYGFPFFSQNHSLYNHSLSQKIRSYDKNYFKDNELILLFIHETSKSPSKINSLKINDETLKIEIDKNTESGDDVLNVWLFLIEVTEHDVDDIDKIITTEKLSV